MILMLEQKEYPPKGYINIKVVRNLLNRILGVDLNPAPLSKLHKILLDNHFPYKKINVSDTDNKKTLFYYKGFILSLEREETIDATIALYELANSIYEKLGILSPILKNKSFKNAQKINDMEEPEETPWDETNMDYVNQELLNKYQTD